MKQFTELKNYFVSAKEVQVQVQVKNLVVPPLL